MPPPQTERPPTPFEAHVGHLLHEQVDELTRRWLAELDSRLAEEPRRIFPSQALLDSIPQLLRQLLSEVLPEGEPPQPSFVRDEIERLAALRRAQGYGPEELLQEFDLLEETILEAMLEAADSFRGEVAPKEVMRLALRLQRTLRRTSEATASFFERVVVEERLDRASLLSAFSRAVTHELRNRLNAARLTLDVYRTLPQERSDELLQDLDESLRRLEGAVSDVFSVALAQERESPVPGRRRSLADLVDELCQDLEELAGEHDVRIGTRAVPDAPVDVARVRLTLLNLVGNAIKYRDAAKPERWVEISVSEADEEDAWRVDVRDNGLGIPEELAERVFEASTRGAESRGDAEGDRGAEGERRRRPRGGDGLGLFLAREAIAQLGGRIWIERSAPGEGTTFSFTLPKPS